MALDDPTASAAPTPAGPMRLLQRYIFKELVRTFAFLVSIVTVLLVFVGVVHQTAESGLGPVQILQILPYVVPSLLPFTIPATLLLTVCVVYGRCAADNEVTAAKAAGIHVVSLLTPAFVLAAVMSVCSIFLTDQVIPWAVANIQRTIAMALEDIFIDRLRATHQVTDRDHGFSITVTDVDGKTLIRPCFKYTPAGGKDVTVQAESATLDFDLERQKVILHLVRGQIDAPGERQGWFEKEDQPFPLPYDLPQPKPRHLSISDIREDLKSVKLEMKRRRQHRNIETALALALHDAGRLFERDLTSYSYYARTYRLQAAELRTEIHSRFAMATSCLLFVLLGAPFAIWQARRQFLTSFVLCFFPILIGYYPLMLLMMNQCKHGTINPAWAMWLPNAGVLVVGGYILNRVARH